MKLLGVGKLFFSTLIVSIVLVGCKKSSRDISKSFCFNKEYSCIETKRIVEIETNKGKFILELDGKNAPVTVGNFLDLVQKGAYNKTLFNRVIREPKPYIIQGGDPLKLVNNYKSNISKDQNRINHKSIYSRFIPLEISVMNEERPRYNQLLGANFHERIKLRHVKGSISMARSEALNSASSQFYFSLKSLPELDGRYAVFGEVIKGFDILNLIEEGDYILNINLTK